MTAALAALCLVMASAPPAALALAPRDAATPPPGASAPETPPTPDDATPPPGPTPPPETTPPPDAATPADEEAPPDDATPSEATAPQDEAAPDDAPPDDAPPDATPPADATTDPPEPETRAATVAPTTLPSPGDIEEGADDEPLEDEPLDDEAYDPMRDSPEALQARHFIRAGIALFAVGGALSVTAIVFGTVDPCTKGIGNSCQEAASRRAALAIGIPGAVMIAGGAASLAVGIVRRNQLRASLAVSRGSAIVGVSGRF